MFKTKLRWPMRDSFITRALNKNCGGGGRIGLLIMELFRHTETGCLDRTRKHRSNNIQGEEKAQGGCVASSHYRCRPEGSIVESSNVSKTLQWLPPQASSSAPGLVNVNTGSTKSYQLCLHWGSCGKRT